MKHPLTRTIGLFHVSPVFVGTPHRIVTPTNSLCDSSIRYSNNYQMKLKA